jgi:hypothetical protein
MAKIVLDSEPTVFDECPFGRSTDCCGIRGALCNCVSNCWGSRYFDFNECRFCTTLEKLK